MGAFQLRLMELAPLLPHWETMLKGIPGTVLEDVVASWEGTELPQAERAVTLADKFKQLLEPN